MPKWWATSWMTVTVISSSSSSIRARTWRSSSAKSTPVGPRRSAERKPIGDYFENTADSDPALPATREWAARAVAAPRLEPTSPHLGSTAAVDEVVATAREAGVTMYLTGARHFFHG